MSVKRKCSFKITSMQGCNCYSCYFSYWTVHLVLKRTFNFLSRFVNFLFYLYKKTCTPSYTETLSEISSNQLPTPALFDQQLGRMMQRWNIYTSGGRRRRRRRRRLHKHVCQLIHPINHRQNIPKLKSRNFYRSWL